MSIELLVEPTETSDNFWFWEWQDDFEDSQLKGKITAVSELTITSVGDTTFFEYTLADCSNSNALMNLRFDVVISLPKQGATNDDGAQKVGLSLWSDEGVPITRVPSQTGFGKRKGVIPKQLFEKLRIGKAGRAIYLPAESNF